MSFNATPINQVAYLQTSRSFPNKSIPELALEVDKSYLEIALAINSRTISLFPTNRPAITGEAWYYTSRKQQTLRQIYPFTAAGTIPHGITFVTFPTVQRGFGYYTDGTDSFGVIYGTSVPVAGQISFYVTPINIVVLDGGGSPAIVSGTIVIEWLSQINTL